MTDRNKIIAEWMGYTHVVVGRDLLYHSAVDGFREKSKFTNSLDACDLFEAEFARQDLDTEYIKNLIEVLEGEYIGNGHFIIYGHFDSGFALAHAPPEARSKAGVMTIRKLRDRAVLGGDDGN